MRWSGACSRPHEGRPGSRSLHGAAGHQRTRALACARRRRHRRSRLRRPAGAPRSTRWPRSCAVRARRGCTTDTRVWWRRTRSRLYRLDRRGAGRARGTVVEGEMAKEQGQSGRSRLACTILQIQPVHHRYRLVKPEPDPDRGVPAPLPDDLGPLPPAGQHHIGSRPVKLIRSLLSQADLLSCTNNRLQPSHTARFTSASTTSFPLDSRSHRIRLETPGGTQEVEQ